MTVTHIYHSGFLVELEHTLLLFDYYQGQLPPLNPQKPLFVFVSHLHYDHFDPIIWQLSQQHPQVFYVVDQAISVPPEHKALTVQPRREYQWQGLVIRTLQSTDEGSAFVVQAEGLQIYHAGDLNWWHWEGEPDQANLWHDQAFHAELDSLRGQTLDLAFIPLDPRQQDNAWWGFADFLKACPCRHVFPMHYADNKPGMLAYLKQPALAPWLDCIHTEDCWQGPQR